MARGEYGGERIGNSELPITVPRSFYVSSSPYASTAGSSVVRLYVRCAPFRSSLAKRFAAGRILPGTYRIHHFALYSIQMLATAAILI
jgi:hypothetical protein